MRDPKIIMVRDGKDNERVSVWIACSFGRNPKSGGKPARDRSNRDRINFVLWDITGVLVWDKTFCLLIMKIIGVIIII